MKSKYCTKLYEKFENIKSKIKVGATFEEVKEELKELYIEVKDEIDSLIELLEEIKRETLKLKRDTQVRDPLKFVQRLQITDVDVTTFIEKGWNEIAKGNYDEAIKILESVREKAPDNVKVLNLLGWAYVQSGRYDDAFPLYIKVLQIEPMNTMAMKDIGYICYKKGIYGEAIEHLVKVIRINNNPTATLYALYYLGLIYLDREMYDDAISFFQKALEKGPNLVEAIYHLGITYEKKKEYEKAKESYRKVIEIAPDSKWAQKAIERLENV
ncbi:MAG: tetratricopeptide repeat protein [Candidatus Hydrothermales bacterium]